MNFGTDAVQSQTGQLPEGDTRGALGFSCMDTFKVCLPVTGDESWQSPVSTLHVVALELPGTGLEHYL